MKGAVKTFFAGLVCSSLLLGLSGSECSAQQTNSQSPKIKTNFVKDAILSDKEIKQVLELAKMCGIEKAGVISTFHFRPGRGKGVNVESIRRINGRDTYFETLAIQKESWGGYHEVDEDVKRVGEFLSKPKDKYTTRLRSYEFRKRAVQVALANAGTLNVGTADKAIELIGESKVQFASDGVRRKFKGLGDAIPVWLDMTMSVNGYRLEMDESDGRMHIITFKFEKDELIITGVGDVVI
jgi:hypothetical protein